MSITSSWINDAALRAVAANQRGRNIAELSYATVRDFVDSFELLNRLTTAQGDLKDVQRPWILKAIMAKLPRGGRLVEIGGGQPYVADLLARLGYEVWIVDPYDGSGNGPTEFETYRRDSPKVRFVRALFDDQVSELPPSGIDCVYSISVLEHVPYVGLQAVFRGMQKYLTKDGWSIHAVDHVHKGAGAREHLDRLRFLVAGLGHSSVDLDDLFEKMNADPDTYYLSAESHNRWRGATPYEQFPMRVCVSVQMCGTAGSLRSRG